MDGDKPRLTRRRYPDAPSKTWHDDVRVGTIAKAEGQRGFTYWTRDCGFSVNGASRDHRSGAAATYDDARAASLPHGPNTFQSERQRILTTGAAKPLGLPRSMHAGVAGELRHGRYLGLCPDRHWHRNKVAEHTIIWGRLK
ncbi:hypothetical protein ABIE49_002638 [Bradyrhizobium sp. OAE829]